MPSMTRKGNRPATTQKAPRRKSKATETLEAFPVREPFTTIAQVNEYLGGEHIVCLLCGKKLKALATHLLKVHEVSADTYRDRYGIPWTFGLIPAVSREKISRAQKVRWDNGTSPILGYQGENARGRTLNAPRRPAQEATRRLNREKLETMKPVECRCACGKPFTKGPHSMTKKVCDDCYRAKSPWRFMRSVEVPCDQCGATFEKGPTSKRGTCPDCVKNAKQERKNARRRTGRPLGRPGHRPKN